MRWPLASAPEHLVSMHTETVSIIYGSTVFGTVALEQLDPATGDTWQSCILSDSVSVGAAVVSPVGIAYFSGSFMGDALAFCDGSQLAGLGGAFTVNHFVMAWNLNTGQPLWSRNLDLDFPDILEPAALAVDPEGNLWYSAMEFSQGHIVRVDFFGEDVEVRTIDGIRRFGTISFDPWGGLYVSGSCENGTLTFGGQDFPVASAEGYNMFVLRYRPDGTAGFAEFGTDVTFTDPTVVATSDGHAYLAGQLHLDGEVWPGLQFEGMDWGSDVFIAMLDSTGQFHWGRETHSSGGGITGDIERAQGPCIAVDAGHNVYFTGVTRGSVEWTTGVVSGGPVITDRRLTVVAFDPDGSPQWAASSGPSTWFVTGQSITASAEADAVHFVSHVSGELTFGPFTVNSDSVQAAVFGRISVLSMGLGDTLAQGAMQVWPNPAANMLYAELDGTTVVTAELLNSAGQRVRIITLAPGRNSIDVAALSAGLYLLRTARGDAVRVVVE
ncbi:MAG: T9SS type A sorting domain-containing protein [Flavobacteriales bacterium]|nr:T9SS type A sorting domain-containing protein [Flavobacteriales bacterium]